MEFPAAVSSPDKTVKKTTAYGKYDMRDFLSPRRLTLAMWDQAYILRHIPGGSYADYDRVLDETIERGYNTVRIDPMPHLVDLSRPETVLVWPEAHLTYMPWYTDKGMQCPAGAWMIEFMEKLLTRKLHYTLSSWWYCTPAMGPVPAKTPRTHIEAAQMYARQLEQWQKRFGFEGLVYVDIANEVPYFLPDYLKTLKQKVGLDWGMGQPFTPEQTAFLQSDLNAGLALLRGAFPELRFTYSTHADTRWMDLGVEFDCLDVHFWADADPRWVQRTRLHDMIKPDSFIDQWPMFCDASGFKNFSDRCRKTAEAVRPMLRARQRQKMAVFADWSKQKGMPLTSSESWASWFYCDHPDLDWGWLLSWAEDSVDDAIAFDFWGWTPHNYVQPHFKNWQDVRWHQTLTHKFLAS